ncbi:MAG: hypothetical protein WC718_01660 [Phycisphaerales bacterium]|jgi:hypothetical protein
MTTRQQHRGLGVRAIGAALVFAVILGGCADPLFSPDEPRSQYDRNDALRGQHAPPYVFDQYGARKPNIRQRLLTVGN